MQTMVDRIQRTIMDLVRAQKVMKVLTARGAAELTDFTHKQMQKILLEAYARGDIEILLHLPAERQAALDLPRHVLRAYKPHGLHEVHLVPGFPGVLDCEDDPSQRHWYHTQVMRKLAPLAADYVANAVKTWRWKDRYRIAIAWGRMMREMTDLLMERAYGLVRNENLEVAPALGVTCTRGSRVEANIIAHELARAFFGDQLQLIANAFVPRHQVAQLKKDDQIREMLEVTLPESDLVLSSLGPVCDSEMSVTAYGKLNPHLVDLARGTAAVGEINYNLVGPGGEEIHTDYETIGLRLPQLKTIASQYPNKSVVLVAGGDPRRFPGIRAAILGGYVSTLITDTVCASYLVERARAEGKID